MKKYFCLLLLVAMCMSFVACNDVNTEDITESENSTALDLSGDLREHEVFTYEINPDGKTCTITGFTAYIFLSSPTYFQINVVIPDDIYGYTVTEIAASAFDFHGQIESVQFSDNITKIGDYAFAGCSFEKLKLPAELTEIGKSAFAACLNLKEVEFGNKLTTIDAYAFMECSSLLNLNLPDSVTHVDMGAFCDCISLETVKLSNGIKAIYPLTFSGCEKLTSIVIPDSVVSIQRAAFKNCKSLKDVELSNMITWIGEYAFAGCDIESLTTHHRLNSISEYAFYECNNLKNVRVRGSENWGDLAEILGNPETAAEFLVNLTESIHR